MIVSLGAEKFDVFRHQISLGNIRKGDFVEVNGQLCRIVEIARGCPSINKYGHGFTICLVTTGDGKRTTFRSLNKSETIWRGKKV